MITLNAAPEITSTLTATATRGTVFNYQIIGDSSPTSFNATGLPGGLSINTTSGLISGTPNVAAGTFNVTLTATNSTGTGTAILTISLSEPILGAPVITSTLAATATRGTAFTYQITGDNSPTSFDATGLPGGLSINTSNGLISGTPNVAAGTFRVTIFATNSTGTGTATLVITLNAAPVITSNLTSTATRGTAFTYQIRADSSPTSFNATGLPGGLSINTSTGEISGIPNAAAGTFNVTLTAANSTGTGPDATLMLTLQNPQIEIPLAALSAGNILKTAGVGATIAVTKTDGFTNVTGSVDPTYEGVTFDGSNLIIAPTAPPLPRGTPSITLTLTARRTVGNSIVSTSTTVPLRIVAPVPTNLRFIESFIDANANQVYDSGESYIDSVLNDQYDSSIASSSLEVFVGEPYSISFTTSASTICPLQDFTITGLPSSSGLQLTTVNGLGGNQISGINTSTTAPSEYTVTLVADTSRSYEGGGTLSSTITFRLRNRNAPYFYPLTSRLLGAQGKYLKFNLSAENSPFKYEAANLPSWLSLKSNQGQWVLEGTPTSAGIFSIPVTAYNALRPGSTNPSDWNAGYGTLIIHVAASRPNNVALTGANNLQVGSSASFYLVPGGAEGAGVRVNATGLPPGLVVDRTTSQVTGTPTAKGSFVVTIYIQNGKGWVTKTMTLTVR